MTASPRPDPSAENDPAARDRPDVPTPEHRRPSEEATADIEERQETERAEERKAGRPPAEAPPY
jgi:hypothetical protein